MRTFLLVLACLIAGCGKSFQEAEAIYKDELEKLEALQAEYDREYAAAYTIVTTEASLRELDGKDPRIDQKKLADEVAKLDEKYDPLIEAQRNRVKEAEAEKDAAK